MNRNLDGIYFRVARKGKYENLCFSDLKEDERVNILSDKSAEYLRTMCLHLASTLRTVGDEFDIVCK